jgi:diguanylate cyclase
MSGTNLTLARQLESRAREVESLTQRLEKAETEAISDPLTGLMNRRGLEQIVLAKAGSRAGGMLASCALLLIDVDDFKKINDTHGHEVGDQVLRGVARVLKARIKGEDTAARLGGDEFAVFLPDTTLEGAVAVGEGIRRSLLQAHLRRGKSEDLGTVRVSIGAAYTGEGGNLDALMRDADAALYQAKREGRNQVRSSKT